MVTDSEPRYRLVDGNGNPVGSVYAEPDGTLKLQEGSGSDNEAVLQPDGTLSVPSVSTGEATVKDGTLSFDGLASGGQHKTESVNIDGPERAQTGYQRTTGVNDTASNIFDNPDQLGYTVVFGEDENDQAGFVDILLTTKWTSGVTVIGSRSSPPDYSDRLYSRVAGQQIELALNDVDRTATVLAKTVRVDPT